MHGGPGVDYGIIEFLVGIVTIVGFMYKFEKDTREEFRRDIGDLRERLTRVEDGIERLGEGLGRLANAINGVGEAIVDYLGFRGVLKSDEANYLKSDIKRLTSIATNPFTEAERKRLLELVDKDDLTIEEAEELHELARKFYREYIEKTPDAWKVLFYAAAKHGEVLRKHGASGKQPSQPST